MGRIPLVVLYQLLYRQRLKKNGRGKPQPVIPGPIFYTEGNLVKGDTLSMAASCLLHRTSAA